jgi:hypothetical protein
LIILQGLWAAVDNCAREGHALVPMNCFRKDQCHWNLPALKSHSFGNFFDGNSGQRPVSPVVKCENDGPIPQFFYKAFPSISESRSCIKVPQSDQSIPLEKDKTTRREIWFVKSLDVSIDSHLESPGLSGKEVTSSVIAQMVPRDLTCKLICRTYLLTVLRELFTSLDICTEEGLSNLNVISTVDTKLSGEIIPGEKIIESSDLDTREK